MQPFTFPLQDTLTTDMKAVMKLLKATPPDIQNPKTFSNITGSTGTDSEDK